MSVRAGRVIGNTRRMALRVSSVGIVLGIVTSGCDFPKPPDVEPDGGHVGGGDEHCVSFASQIDTCKLSFDSDLLLADNALYDTTSHLFTISGVAKPIAHVTVTILGSEVDVISAHDVRLASNRTLRGVGSRPLALVASGSVTIEFNAQIDVGIGGAGAPTKCDFGPGPPDDNAGGAGGGGGGGLGDRGGDGTDSDSDGPLPHPKGGSGGLAVAPTPSALQGGCPGRKGGDGVAPGGAGGIGGGALYLVAANFIEFDGPVSVSANGDGGRGGSAGGNAGGGGGGSGGMLVVEAPHVMGSAAKLVANGGGGGEGSDLVTGGADGSPGTMTTSGAHGGEGLAEEGSAGGRGGSLDVPYGEKYGGVNKGGGGGGGGGVGIIRIVSPDVHLGTSSPRPI